MRKIVQTLFFCMFIILFVNLFNKTDNKMLWYMLYMYQVYLMFMGISAL